LSAFLSVVFPSDDNNIENCENEEVGQQPPSIADELSMLLKQAEKPQKNQMIFPENWKKIRKFRIIL
jgi:hypothetical protein